LVTKLEPRYRAQGGAVSFTRSTPRGSPEKIRLEREGHRGSYAASGRQAIEPADEEAPVVAFERYAGKAGGTSVPIPRAHIPIETSPAQQFPKRQGRDAELERLRRIEVNYEKDKAALAREKQPALARSESHDVGHAQGSDQVNYSGQEERKFFSDFKKEVMDELRLRNNE
jgi:hypothetical protein